MENNIKSDLSRRKTATTAMTLGLVLALSATLLVTFVPGAYSASGNWNPALKVSCPGNDGFVGNVVLKVFKQTEQIGQTTINCTSANGGTQLSTVALPPNGNSANSNTRATSWVIDMLLTNTNNGHSDSGHFTGRYQPD